MSKDKNPGDDPAWNALSREAQLIRHLAGSGATALGKANYADKTGEYYTAFFGLSVALERLAKLILIADYAITNNGEMPPKDVVRKFGHKLVDLMNEVTAIGSKHRLDLEFGRPTSPVVEKMVECLDAFADASRGRYANFAVLGDPNLDASFEPIRRWWSQVAELILQHHYYGKPLQARVEANAQLLHHVISDFTMVLHTNEAGEVMDDVATASIRTGQTEVVQKYGRYYALTVVRWLSCLFSDLSHQACFQRNIISFSGMNEFFQTYTVDDQFLKTRKIWPLT